MGDKLLCEVCGELIEECICEKEEAEDCGSSESLDNSPQYEDDQIPF